MKDYKYLLLFRWLLVNLFGVFLLSLAYIYGGVDLVLASDQTYLSVLIFIVFVCGLILSGFKTFKISRELNHIKEKNDKSKWEKVLIDLHLDDISNAKIIEILTEVKKG